jgi:5-methylcytosine-specific restriction enzyme A
VSRWAGSNRRARLPDDWHQRRATVIERDPTCRLRIVCHGAPSTEADHIQAGDDHRLTNLQGVCLPCHARKSSGEGHAARYRNPRRRPTEQHPGLFDPGVGGTPSRPPPRTGSDTTSGPSRV